MRRARFDKDLTALTALGILVILRWLPDWARGLSPYWGDLTYLHMPWRRGDIHAWRPSARARAVSQPSGCAEPGSGAGPFFRASRAFGGRAGAGVLGGISNLPDRSGAGSVGGASGRPWGVFRRRRPS